MTSAAHAETDLARFQWTARVLLLFAPGDKDPRLESQRDAIAKARAGMKDRDLVVIEAIGLSEPALRRRFRVPGDSFAAILIGKDGGEKQRAFDPIPAPDLFATIDQMPMRRSEARRSKVRRLPQRRL